MPAIGTNKARRYAVAWLVFQERLPLSPLIASAAPPGVPPTMVQRIDQVASFAVVAIAGAIVLRLILKELRRQKPG